MIEIDSREVEKNLKAVGDAIFEIIEQAVLSAGDEIQSAAEQNAPGDGLGVVKEVTKKEPLEVTVGIGADKDHWYYDIIEFGRRPYRVEPDRAKALLIDGEFVSLANIPPLEGRPWLRPAFDENSDEAIAEMGRIFWQAIEDAIK